MAVSDARLSRILETLRSSGFRDIAGARVTATIPLAGRLLNDLIAASLPPSGAIRELSVHALAENRLGVRVRLAHAGFLPLTATLAIERQPRLPDEPHVDFRVMGLPGLLALAAPLVSMHSMLPPGILLERDRLRVDIGALLAHHGQGDLLAYVEDLRLTAEEGRLLIEVKAAAR